MKKYYPVDFDEKGNAVLGKAKDTPTSNGFIPTTWVPGGGSEDAGNGIKSISISPAITTTPALDSLFPIYWEDLTEEEKADGKGFHVDADVELVGTDTYTITVTPTADWYAFNPNSGITGGKGEPITFERNPSRGELNIDCGASREQDTEEAGSFIVALSISKIN